MNVFDQIMELEAQKQKLLEEAKQDALKRAEKAVKELNDLGFHYQLVEGSTGTKQPTTNRRRGISDEVLQLVKSAPSGLSRADVLDKLNAETPAEKQSISNALANLKKKGTIVNNDGVYTKA